MNTRPALAAAALAICAGAGATTLHVDDNAPLDGDGLAWSSAFRHLQDALAAASGDPTVTEIRVAGGIHRPDRSEFGNATAGDRNQSFVLINGVALRGGYRGLDAGGSPDDRDPAVFVTALSGDLNGDDEPQWVNSSENSHHVVRAAGAGAGTRLEGVTVTAGNAWESSGGNSLGAGLKVESGSVLAVDCRFVASISHLGGGVAVLGGAVDFQGCDFAGNWAYVGRGGAIWVSHLATMRARDCVFTDNESYGPGSVGDGGAVFLEGGPGPINFVRCDFWSNESSSNLPQYANGGAVCSLADELRFVSCRFGRNTALVAGALWVAGNTTIVNCEFDGNSALVGGAISAFTATTTIANSTFVGNSAGDGGALDNNWSSVATISNSVFWGSQSNDPTGLKKAIHNVDGSETNVRYTCIQGLFDTEPGEDPIDPANYPGCTEADPLLVDANGSDNILGTPDDDTRLSAGSPVVDAGRNSHVPADLVDLDGDANVAEKTPADLWGEARFTDDPNAPDTGHGAPPIVDMGASERTTGPTCPADLNGDLVVDFGDLNILLDHYNAIGSPGAILGDIDGDGDVDFADLNSLLGAFNTPC